jgi:hypothetical protein
LLRKGEQGQQRHRPWRKEHQPRHKMSPLPVSHAIGPLSCEEQPFRKPWLLIRTHLQSAPGNSVIGVADDA